MDEGMLIMLVLRWVERIAALVAGVVLVIFGVKQAARTAQQGNVPANQPENSEMKIESNIQQGTFNLTLTRYGPAVVLSALGLAVIIITFLSPLKLESEDGERIWYYAETNPRIQQLLPLLSADEMEELRAAVIDLHRQNPSADSTIRVSRVYEAIYYRGRLTEEQAQRVRELLNKDSLSQDERAELKALRARYREEFAPTW